MSKRLFLNGTNVRFDSQTRQRVERLASKWKLKKADLIRAAPYSVLPRWERDGVKLVGPEAGDER